VNRPRDDIHMTYTPAALLADRIAETQPSSNVYGIKPPTLFKATSSPNVIGDLLAFDPQTLSISFRSRSNQATGNSTVKITWPGMTLREFG